MNIQDVAQLASDLYYANYKSDNDYYSLDDFVVFCAFTAGEFYSNEFRNQLSEKKQDNDDSVVSFSAAVLARMDLDVQVNEEGDHCAQYTSPVFSFVYDGQYSGIQNVEPLGSAKDCKLERTTRDSVWNLDYTPKGTAWYLPERTGITILKGDNIKKIRVWYVPGIGPDAESASKMEIADGIVAYVVQNTAQNVKQLVANEVIKKSLDQNQNKAFQTEANPKALPRS